MDSELTGRPWKIRRNSTDYPDLFTYTVLGTNHERTGSFTGEHFHVAGPLDSDADASLIAAAPELLEALKDIVRHPGFVNCGVNQAEKAAAAIAKAEGRS